MGVAFGRGGFRIYGVVKSKSLNSCAKCASRFFSLFGSPFYCYNYDNAKFDETSVSAGHDGHLQNFMDPPSNLLSLEVMFLGK